MNPTNRFKIVTLVHLPHGEEYNIHSWLNIQYTGKPSIPLNVKCSKKHQNAGYTLHACRDVEIEIEIDKNGNWKLIDAKLC